MRFALSALNTRAEALLHALESTAATVEFGTDGTILDTNETFLSLTGYSLPEVRGRHHRMFVPESHGQSEEYKSFWGALNRGEQQTLQVLRVGKDGREIWLNATYTPILDRRGKPVRIVKLATDITADMQRRADQQSQLAAIERAQAVVQFDLSGTILDANDRFLMAMGYSLDEVRGQQHWMFVTPAAAQSQAYGDFWEALKRGEPQGADFQLQGRGAREVWLRGTYNPILDPSGRPSRIVLHAVDITEEKRITVDYGGQIAAINRLHAVAHFDLSGNILNANANFLEIFGYEPGEIEGQHHFMLVEDAYAVSPEYKVFWERLGRGEHFSGVYQRVGKGGRNLWIQASYNPILDAGGQPFKVVEYATDITASMEARARAVAATEQTLSNVRTASTAAEEMKASIDGITASMNRSKEAVDAIQGQALAADKSTGQLRHATHSMDDVVQLIAKISQQINLLALNATIEAARAGEAGKGFAVVATEVKNLANQAHSATTRISDQIAAMQHASDDVIGTIASICEAIGTVQGFVSEAAGAIQEHSLATQEIVTNMQAAAGKVASINRSLEDWVIGLEERRREPRIRTFKQAMVRIKDRPDSIKCIVRDISASGARFELKGSDVLPPTFRLSISGEPAERNCAVVRQGNGTVSVRFV